MRLEELATNREERGVQRLLDSGEIDFRVLGVRMVPMNC